MASSEADRCPVSDKLMHPPAVPTLCHTQISRCGRWVGRLRNLHRPSRSSKPNFKGVALNTQGLNWRLLSHAHKLRALIQTARERQLSFVMLSELHVCTEDWQDPELMNNTFGQFCPPGVRTSMSTRRIEFRWECHFRKLPTLPKFRLTLFKQKPNFLGPGSRTLREHVNFDGWATQLACLTIVLRNRHYGSGCTPLKNLTAVDA